MLELQNTILEMVARGEALSAVTEKLCRKVEALAPGAFCSVLEVDAAGLLHPVAGPSLPDHYSAALDGTMIGPMVGSCGSAAYLCEPVAVTDIAVDPRWIGFAELALPLGLRACWSSPIVNARRAVIGTFAFYYRECRGPTPLERQLVSTCVHLCSIAISHHRWQVEQHRRAFEDPLTGLPNRAAFAAALEHLPCDAPDSWGLLMVDLDNLKIVNDTFGHHIGDRLIEAAAERVADAVAPHKAYRLGGDEFAVLVRSAASSADLEKAADSVLAALAAPVDCGGHSTAPSATIGSAILSLGDTAERVRQNADIALYHAKETLRGGFVHYSPHIGSRITKRLEAIRQVDAALREDRLLAYYQPIYRLDSRAIVGFEALCRMREADRLVPTADFQDATGDLWIATALTERMLGLVAADIKAWMDRGLLVDHVSVNLCAADLHGGQIADQLRRTMGAAGVPLDRIVLEMAEAAYVGQPDHAIARQLVSLRQQGVRVALDDFGTGISSLTRFMTAPLDFLKIDRKLVERLARDRISGAIVEALLHIAREAGVHVVAEGVETAEQADLLSAAGCNFAQGYFFSEPLNGEAATALLVRQTGADLSLPGASQPQLYRR
ncbi:EAL domain-containing protein [Sphingomonas psychrotolerans]|uniref:EAL domain-containing protein n=1 Tax=Sphingomonas psychrotolerans TaxID=1327635 RepID=A0ABU3N2E3_9SPHN|nr:EAL domain-containing protein [Sphingomonas psychrotolerans]MDT8758436.1 EAL domain-containing protein [Sphingomonas psychrotolerans]